VTLVGAIASALTQKDTLHLTTHQASSAGTWYLIGACAGALFFGYLTDRLGRKRLFMVTLGVYLVFTVATAFAWNFYSFAIFRVLAGAGIGGEYAAINSAIDELIPARVRGRVALAINGSWWFGTAFAAFLSYMLLEHIRASISWRLGFAIGAILALAILTIRRFIPESPRWLLTHGRAKEAEHVVGEIEDEVRKTHPNLPEPEGDPLVVEQREHIGFVTIAKYVVNNYPSRGVLGLSLMSGQAFLYNAVFFTYTLVLTDFFNIDAAKAPLFLIPFAVGNVAGPLLLGPLFDSVGRRVMISFTYITSGVLLIVTGQLFTHNVLSATTMTICWSVIFFFASCKRRLLDGERALPARGARNGDRAVLRRRHGHRSAVADTLRRADRDAQQDERELRLPARRVPDDRRRPGRSLPRGGGRAEVPRGRRAAPHRCASPRTGLASRACSGKLS
jgi:MFS family permease